MSNEKKPSQFEVPYPLVVQYETVLRDTLEFWKFRSITNLIRQNPKQIEKIKKRYSK